MAHNGGATRPRIDKEKAREESTRRSPTEKAIKAGKKNKAKSKNANLEKLPEEVLTNRHHDATTFGASLTTREARNVGNIGLPKFGATVPDIGPARPKSPTIHISSPSFDNPGPNLM
ncbi:hypothetical protein PIB30_008963 [Stylosanthes scabra]|uniref:Uncharacterized protein n=1 Tax=Stylosanthes scabra TaxID=79078 RepID=A0ABU6S5F1_9FABA|nr:hypothetical protein [Stylosanthes scabra]